MIFFILSYSMTSTYSRKVKVLCPSEWNHHRGGWASCVTAMKDSLHIDHGVPFYTNTILSKIDQEPLREPWMAVLHVTRLDRLEDRCDMPNWKASLPWCRGVYVLCQNTLDYVKSTFGVKTNVLVYPCEPCDTKFEMSLYHNNPQKRVVHVGHWLRKPEKIAELSTSLRKTILTCLDQEYSLPDVDTPGYLYREEYDEMLSKNIMFLYLEDSSANTSILECIVRNTPVLVNRLPAVEEYLGKDYPLFYEDMEDASDKLNDESIYLAHQYLKSMDKERFTLSYFVNSIANSEIYESLPKPYLF